MITKDNLKQVFDIIDAEQAELIAEAYYDIHNEGMYVGLELLIFNSGAYVSVYTMPYNETIEQEFMGRGQLFTSAYDFMELFHESLSENEYLNFN